MGKSSIYTYQASGNSSNTDKSSGQSSSGPSCRHYDGSHWLGFKCDKFMAKTPLERREFITNSKLCYNCFGPHRADLCKDTRHCQKCKGPHHTLIHDGSFEHRQELERQKSRPSVSAIEENQGDHGASGSRGSSSTSSSPSSTKTERIYDTLNSSEISQGSESTSKASGSIESSIGSSSTSSSPSSTETERIYDSLNSSEISQGSESTSKASGSIESSIGHLQISATSLAKSETSGSSSDIKVHHQHHHHRGSESTSKASGSIESSIGHLQISATSLAKSETSGSSSDIKVTHQSSSNSASQRVVLLATAKALASTSTGSHHMVRLLIDQGSEVTFITDQMVQLLRLRRSSSHLRVFGIGGLESGLTRGAVKVKLQSRFNDQHQIEITAHILAKFTSTLPSIHCAKEEANHLQHLQLADNNYLKPGPIDIIIGADHYGQIIGHEVIKSPDNQLVAQQTIFGWIVSGTVCCTDCKPKSALTAVRESPTEQLLDLLKKFWVQEELSSSKEILLNQDDQECELHFRNTHSRDSEGRYVVRLPLKTSLSALGESRRHALQLLNRTAKKLESNQEYGKLYKDFIREYEDLGHMRRVSEESEPSVSYYLPHHGVLREDNITTKLRVVFNGSSKTTSGVSLNDILHAGGKLQTEGSDVLIWLRTFRLIVGTDIVKMFRQIKVHQEDWDLQRILWKDEEGKIITYQLTTVTYGQTCAPWLALRVLQQLVEDEGHQYTLAAVSLTKGRYVDDIYGGADSEEQLKELINQLINLCMAGGMPLQKWISNQQGILQDLQLSTKSTSAVEFEDKTVKEAINGKNQQKDNPLRDRPDLRSSGTCIIGPVIIRAKIFIQELWLLKIGWDDPLPLSHIKRWKEFREEFSNLDQISIPRWLQTSSTSSNIQLHGFADASNQAMGAAVYIRVDNHQSEPSIILVSAKTKVAPLKKMTIPRLELTAAVILTNLVIYIRKMLEKENLQLFLWSDSTVALTWINGHPSRWKDFVQNRVIKIQNLLPAAEWKHIRGVENPADCASRGLSPDQLVNHQLWWNGPSWLKLSMENWPSSSSTSIESTAEAALEERPVSAHPVALNLERPQDFLERYSTLDRLVRISARVLRVINNMRGEPVPRELDLLPEELEETRIFWINYTQQESFGQIINRLINGQDIANNHPMARLIPYLDENQTIRLGGRLKQSNLQPEARNPSILPRQSRLTSLVIEEAHRKTLHGGVQATLAHIRHKYWIIGGRHPVKSHIRKCVICARHRAIRGQQLMGQLPPRRITSARPFNHAGVDYAGPIKISRWRGSGARQYHGYIAVFVCLATSAIHLELLTDLTSQAFIETYKRFTGRRGICATLSSDNAKTFMGANNELGKLLDESRKEIHHIINELASNGTKWIFIPPQSPHMGGEWEAAVKSVKFHLKRLTGNLVLTYEELNTLIIQIEAQLNSRPLCALSDDPDDCRALTPGHFIIGEPINAVPEPSLINHKMEGLTRWKMIARIAQQFWDRWSRECMHHYQTIYKWKRSTDDIKVGTLVLIIDERYPPTKWPLGRVSRVHPSDDNLTRVVDITIGAGAPRRKTNKSIIHHHPTMKAGGMYKIKADPGHWIDRTPSEYFGSGLGHNQRVFCHHPELENHLSTSASNPPYPVKNIKSLTDCKIRINSPVTSIPRTTPLSATYILSSSLTYVLDRVVVRCRELSASVRSSVCYFPSRQKITGALLSIKGKGRVGFLTKYESNCERNRVDSTVYQVRLTLIFAKSNSTIFYIIKWKQFLQKYLMIPMQSSHI
ncbi:uncharacterized protein LOC135164483 [Diachasmimorpha longicaudata]|uniref:uncharacterized protein LOC135164483 n=1 Tax=Diachasmimorpha longicaudata TaxID=58733 RepID=UPI0030B903A4